jgi:3-hydroxybutyryl-CoA dehydrogenase
MRISVVGMVGAGFMDSGIAESLAAVHKHVVVYEPERAPLEHSRERVAGLLKRMVVSGHHSRNLGRGFYEHPVSRDLTAVAA